MTNIKDLRTKRGLTLQQLADLTKLISSSKLMT
jgi:transcriptional regulator with XRE-family HTH domain